MKFDAFVPDGDGGDGPDRIPRAAPRPCSAIGLDFGRAVVFVHGGDANGDATARDGVQLSLSPAAAGAIGFQTRIERLRLAVRTRVVVAAQGESRTRARFRFLFADARQRGVCSSAYGQFNVGVVDVARCGVELAVEFLSSRDSPEGRRRAGTT